MNKILIVTYYWPPAGGPGVQRWLKFVKYLPEFDITPVVVIPDNPTYPIVDMGLLDELGSDIELIRVPIREPYKLASFFSSNKSNEIAQGIVPIQRKQNWIEKSLLWIRGNMFIPDARIGWVEPVFQSLKKYIIDNDIQTCITTGPPHSVHLIGEKLKKEFGLKWIADFRDPWTTIGYHKELKLTKSSQEKHLSLEKSVLSSADSVIVTSPITKDEFSAKTNQPIHVITNGYDVMPKVSVPLDSKFTLVHIGSMLSERNPRILWKALHDLVNNNPEFAQDFELHLVGKVGQEIFDAIDEFKLTKFLKFHGYVTHQKAMLLQRAAQVLLLIEIDREDTKAIIPGKIFEYMVSHRPILAIGPEGAAFKSLLKSTNTGVFFEYDQKDDLESQILTYYNEYKIGKLQSHPIGLQAFSRKNLTKELAHIIHSLHGNRR